MKRVLAVLVLVTAVACGSTTAPLGAPLNVSQLKLRVIDAAGSPAFCDPDFYPLARAGGEQASADAAYPTIKADAQVYAAIVAHEGLPASGDLNEAQKLSLYRAFKQLRVLNLAPSGSDAYSFSYLAQKGGGYVMVTGKARIDGVVTIDSQTTSHAPNCPICLSAATRIATPQGDVLVTTVEPGTLVWTLSAVGARIAVRVIEVGSTPAPPGHMMVHLRLADGREVWVSPGHRTADGRPLGMLAAGDLVDGSRVVVWELVPYNAARTYDLLPDGPTGVYWADGIALQSTLHLPA